MLTTIALQSHGRLKRAAAGVVSLVLLRWIPEARRAIAGRLGRALDRRERCSRVPRRWSNAELRKLAGLFDGDVINVSAWRDEDKEGRHYRDYFSNARSYTLSNVPGERGATGREGELTLDLERDLPANLHLAFNAVFNHTTLEHVFGLGKAFANLCRMSRDAVIVVVPFLQPSHATAGMGDYWRFTPQGVRMLFAENGFQAIYESANAQRGTSVYLVVIAVRDPARWRGVLPLRRLPDADLGCHLIHNPPFLDRMRRLLGRMEQ